MISQSELDVLFDQALSELKQLNSFGKASFDKLSHDDQLKITTKISILTGYVVAYGKVKGMSEQESLSVLDKVIQ